MKVTLSSSGRFHIYDLAKQLLSRGYLAKWLTGYPIWKVDNVLRPYTSSFPWVVGPQILLWRYGIKRIADSLSPATQIVLDQWVAKNLPDSDIFVGLSQTALQSLKTAKKRGMMTICDRGSSHIVHQNAMLTEEFKKVDIHFDGIPSWAIERELAEYEEADRITVPSTFAKQTFIDQGVPEHKVFVLNYGVDLSDFYPVPKEDDVFRVLFVGRMAVRKGMHYLLEAVSKLNLSNFELWLIGAKEPETDAIFENYGSHFTYLGTKPRKDLLWYYSQASVFVIPSIEEGLALVQAQAMACRVPIIATPNTGSEDLITNGVEGYIIPVGSINAIHDSILYLYENPHVREKMAQAALDKVKMIGGWDTYGEQAVSIYHTMLRR